jgi:hypothetical protein
MTYYRPPGLTIDTQQIRRSSCRPGWRSWYQGQLYGGSRRLEGRLPGGLYRAWEAGSLC